MCIRDRDIQSYEAFVQIPVVLRDNTSTGELYIMKRKGKRGKIKPDDFSLFLSLTTKYPVSYTHLDVYKRQKHSYGASVNKLADIYFRKLQKINEMCIRDSSSP